jgi:hypothetical protein
MECIMQHVVMDWLNDQAAVWYEEGISKLVSRYKCLNVQGDCGEVGEGVIKPSYSVFLLSINIFVWQNVLYFPNDPHIYAHEQ